jgi:hypothetical protein
MMNRHRQIHWHTIHRHHRRRRRSSSS